MPPDRSQIRSHQTPDICQLIRLNLSKGLFIYYDITTPKLYYVIYEQPLNATRDILTTKVRKGPFLGVNNYFLGKCSPIVGDDLTTKARRCDILTTKVRMTELTNLQKWPTQNTPKNWSHVNIFRTQLQVLDSFPWKLLFLALLSAFSVHCSKTSTKYITIREGGRGVRGGLVNLQLCNFEL